MVLSAQALERFLTSPDPIKWAWDELLTLYAPSGQPASIIDFYDQRETQICTLEETIYRCYFEFYDRLLHRALEAGEQLGPSRFFAECDFVVVADSLSLREAALLPAYLDGTQGWQAEVTGHFCSPFPTETKSLSQLLLGTPSPAQGRDTSTFSYRYVPGPGAIPHLPSSGNLLLWLRLPDASLQDVRAAMIRTVKDAFEDTLRGLIALMEHSSRPEALVISDHGYLYARNTSHYWLFPEGMRRRIQRLFGQARRAQDDPDKVDRIREFEAPEPYQKRFVFQQGCASLLGRYWWTIGSANERLTAHGGFSLPEVLIPVVRVRRC